MRRRDLIKATVGAVIAWPVAVHAEQSAMPVIGYLGSSSPAYRGHLLTAFRRGLRESGYVEGGNVTIEYRWAQDQYDRLPDLAADLIGRHVLVIVATDTPSAIAAKAATATRLELHVSCFSASASSVSQHHLARVGNDVPVPRSRLFQQPPPLPHTTTEPDARAGVCTSAVWRQCRDQVPAASRGRQTLLKTRAADSR